MLYSKKLEQKSFICAASVFMLHVFMGSLHSADAVSSQIGFFGIESSGDRIAIILDSTLTMRGDRNQVVLREAIRMLDLVPNDYMVSIICFGGFTWDISGDFLDLAKNWICLPNANGRRAFSNMYPKAERYKPEAKWVKLTNSSRRKFKRQIMSARNVHGVTFDTGFYTAFKLNPLPTTINFVTGSNSSRERGIDKIKGYIAQLKEAHGENNLSAINTIGLDLGSSRLGSEESSDGMHLTEIANLSGGKTVFVRCDKYIKEHGEDKSVDWDTVGVRASGSDPLIEYNLISEQDLKREKYYRFDRL